MQAGGHSRDLKEIYEKVRKSLIMRAKSSFSELSKMKEEKR